MDTIIQDCRRQSSKVSFQALYSDRHVHPAGTGTGVEIGTDTRVEALLRNSTEAEVASFPFAAGDARGLGLAQGREAVHEGDAGVDLGGLAVGVS